MSVKKTVVAGSTGVVLATVAFLPSWEGMDAVAKKDMIGTGHPVTYCYGMTSERGAVKEGTRFTKQQCDQMLAEELPKYWAKIEPCIKVPLPDKTAASLLDAAWNAGPARVCKSPMLAEMNAGDLRGGCEAFDGWIIRSDGQARRGLIARRAGEKHGDKRKSERKLCLEGVAEGLPKPPAPAPKKHWWSWIFK
jgi:lysozyme